MKTERLISLDALRGYTILAMIVVNSPGSRRSIFAPLEHAEWNGWTLTDLIFPFFLFFVGVSVALAYSKKKEVGVALSQSIGKIGMRALKIFALGLFLNVWPFFEFENMRIAGVLQRIAIVFLFCAILFLKTDWRKQLIVFLGIVIGYWMLLGWVPVPMDTTNELALETGLVQRGHRHEEKVEVELASDGFLKANTEPGVNLAAWVDRKFLPGGMYEKTWDPEGLLSTIPSLATGILGMLVGTLVLAVNDPYRRTSLILGCGFLLLIAGEVCSWSFPINKNLWSSSFVLFTGGLATLSLGVCILFVDILGYRKWCKVGVVFGANAIVAYALSMMLKIVFYKGIWGLPNLSRKFVEGLLAMGVMPHISSFVYALFYAAVLYIPVYFLWKKKVFIRL